MRGDLTDKIISVRQSAIDAEGVFMTNRPTKRERAADCLSTRSVLCDRTRVLALNSTYLQRFCSRLAITQRVAGER